MTTLSDIDREIRRLTGEDPLSRPFLCAGSPIGCDVAEVGVNPGTDTPFWPYWNVESGCDKEGWLRDYLGRNGRYKPTRDRIEVLARGLAPLRLLELNLFHRYSRSEATLAREHRETALFDYLVQVAKPRLLLVHGDKPAMHLAGVLGIAIPKGTFVPAAYDGRVIEVYRAERHFAYVSRAYVEEIARDIKRHFGLL